MRAAVEHFLVAHLSQYAFWLPIPMEIRVKLLPKCFWYPMEFELPMGLRFLTSGLPQQWQTLGSPYLSCPACCESHPKQRLLFAS